jgi:hypothetical protein
MGVIVNQGLPQRSPAAGLALHRLHGATRVALAHALRPAFFAATCVSALVLPIVLAGVREVRLRRGFEEDIVEEISGPAAAPPARAE